MIASDSCLSQLYYCDNKLIDFRLKDSHVYKQLHGICNQFFYPKMKGALEEDIIKLGFTKTYIFQPPLLIRHSNLMRSGEKIGIKILNIINRIGLFKSQKPLSVLELAKKMVNETKIKNKLSVNVYKPIDITST